MKRAIFYISDRTGITAEALGHSLISQFENIEFDQVTLPYIDTDEKALELVETIKLNKQENGQKPIIFSTIIDESVRKIVSKCDGLLFDFMATFIGPLEKELGAKSSHTIGRTHGVINYDSYKTRIEAVNFALTADDGSNIHNYQSADLVVIGVSRCGKTPTCLYLALQFGVRAANYPFTEDDMHRHGLPDFLAEQKHKLVGLTIDPQRLHNFRSERRPNSNYSSLKQCQREVKIVKDIMTSENIPFLDTSRHSIEEISTKLLAMSNIKRKIF